MLALAGFPAVATAEIITLECVSEAVSKKYSVIIDTDKRAVLHDGKPGNIALVSAEAIHYFLSAEGKVQAHRYGPADHSLITAVGRIAPATGYERQRSSCRPN